MKPVWEMTFEEWQNDVRRQKDGNPARLTFDDWNREGTQEYTYPYTIRAGTDEYGILIYTGWHRKGTLASTTDPIIRVKGLDDFRLTFGREGLKRRHIRKILVAIQEHQTMKHHLNTSTR